MTTSDPAATIDQSHELHAAGVAPEGTHHDTHEHAHDEHRPDSYYIKVALILAVLTALETSTYWIDFGPLFMPALLIMMAIKFFMVVMLFMHLRFDNKLFSWLFYSGLFLAVTVYIGALATFRFFGGA